MGDGNSTMKYEECDSNRERPYKQVDKLKCTVVYIMFVDMH